MLTDEDRKEIRRIFREERRRLPALTLGAPIGDPLDIPPLDFRVLPTAKELGEENPFKLRAGRCLLCGHKRSSEREKP
jgi:hypothetical protein